MANRFGGSLNDQFSNCSTSRKSQFSSHEGHNTLFILNIPKENEEDIRVQIVNMTRENAIESFDKIEGESEKELNEGELREKELKEKDFRDNELDRKELEAEKLKRKEMKALDIKEKSIISKSSKEEQKNSPEASSSVKDSSVQTTGTKSQNQTKKCFESLAERILQSLQSLEEQPQMRRDVSTEANFPNIESNFFSVESRSVETDYWERTFPNLKSMGVQNEEVFRFRPFETNSTASSNIGRTTSGYGSSSQKTWISPERFARRLRKEQDCSCCGSGVISKSRRSLRNCEDNRKVKNDKDKKKVPSCPILDVTKLEFVEVLLEIGEYTHSLERKLAKMNKSLRTSRGSAIASGSNDRNALRIPGISPRKEVPKLVSESEKEDSNAHKALTLEKKKAQPVGSSTPKSSKPNDEQIWVSLPIYAGSNFEDGISQEEKHFSDDEGPRTQMEVEDFDVDRIQKESIHSFMATFGSDSRSRNVSAQEEESSLIKNPPIASSTPNLEGEFPPVTKNYLNNYRSEKNEVSPSVHPGSSVETQSSNLRINAATSTSSEFRELASAIGNTGNTQNETIPGRNSKSSVRSLEDYERRKTTSISSKHLSSLDSTQYIDLP